MTSQPPEQDTAARTDAPVARDYWSASAFRYHAEILPHLLRFIEGLPAGARLLDAGCGNGVISRALIERGFKVTGADVSERGIALCRETIPQGKFHVASLTDGSFPSVVGGPFDAIVSVEVIEHLYAPSQFLSNCRSMLPDGGLLVLSTPYHGYLKGLVLAATGRLDRHLQAGKEGGHIKFWSKKTLAAALVKNGFRVTGSVGVGRVPGLWKSFVTRAVKTG